MCYFNNLTIDGAKTGSVNGYTNYPEVSAKINKAIGGPNGKMPYWFQFSKNGRHADTTKKKKQCAKANNSTMNRLCALFDNIGNINLNAVGVPPFNGEMFLEAPVTEINTEAVELFSRLDDSNLQSRIDGASMMDVMEMYNAFGYEALKELITDKLTELCGSIEAAYPSIAYTLFVGDGKDKAAHKQMFWRVFGDIALRNLKLNLMTCVTCAHCGMKLPVWTEEHGCSATVKGFFTCVECGKWCHRINGRQKRCPECQAKHRKLVKRASKVKERLRRKEEVCITTSPL